MWALHNRCSLAPHVGDWCKTCDPLAEDFGFPGVQSANHPGHGWGGVTEAVKMTPFGRRHSHIYPVVQCLLHCCTGVCRYLRQSPPGNLFPPFGKTTRHGNFCVIPCSENIHTEMKSCRSGYDYQGGCETRFSISTSHLHISLSTSRLQRCPTEPGGLVRSMDDLTAWTQFCDSYEQGHEHRWPFLYHWLERSPSGDDNISPVTPTNKSLG